MIAWLSAHIHHLGANLRLLIWLLILAVMASLGGRALYHGAAIQSDILAMLPKVKEDPLTQKALDRVEQQLADRVYIGLVSDDQQRAVTAAKTVIQVLSQAPQAFSDIKSADIDSGQALNRFYFPYRFNLLTPTQSERLKNNQIAQLEANTLAQLYNAFGYANSQLLSKDPLLLYPEMLKSLSPQQQLQVIDGVLLGKLAAHTIDTGHSQNGKFVAIVMAKGVGSAFNPNAQLRQLGQIKQALMAAQHAIGQEHSLQVLQAGALFHAAAATRQAKTEVSSLGLASLIGVVLLVWLAFRSVMPLAIASLTIATSLLFAITATLVMFHQLHLLTLVFGTSLIGIAIDYSFHFYCERLSHSHQQQQDATTAVTKVFPAASLALLTTVIAYIGIGLTPFPGMQQVAVFCAAGLMGAYLTLVFAYPKLANGQMRSRQQPLFLAERYVSLVKRLGQTFTRKRGVLATALLSLIAVSGLLQLQVNDDIRALQQSPESVTRQEQQLRQVMSGGTDNQFLLVRAKTEQSLLQQLEALQPSLAKLIDDQLLGNAVNLSAYLPSQNSQQQAYRLQGAIYQDLPNILRRLGMDDTLAASLQTEYHNSKQDFIEPDNLFSSAAGKMFAPLWLAPDTEATDFGAIVLLGGIKDLQAISQAISHQPNVALVDKVEDISRVMAKYRKLTLWLLALALFIAWGIFSLRFGVKTAFMITAVPGLATLFTLTLLGLIGSPLTLFHALALILVFGIGVDYSLFFAETQHGQSVMMAVFMSACSTLMAFGLLAFSHTPAIHYFGLTLLMGIALTFVLSPFILTLTRIEK